MDLKDPNDLTVQALNLVRDHYCLGEILSATELLGGYINRTFLARVANCDKGSVFIVRRYNPITANEKDIEFEHCVIQHLISNGLKVVPSVIENKYGGTYLKTNEVGNKKQEVYFWAVFECLKGEVRYAFYDTNLSDGELCSAATTLAHLHHAGSDFFQKFGINRSQPDIMAYLPTFPDQYNALVQNRADNRFDAHFLEYREDIFKKIDQVRNPDTEFTQMPMGAIHGDYHQGNLTFEGSDVVGVFDFDWTRVDFRLFDLAQSIIYFCACWEGRNAGTLDLEKLHRFLKAYNDTYIIESIKGRLTHVEIKNFPLMLEVANQFVLFCIVAFYYYSEDADEDEYLKALEHYINMMIWMDANRSILDDITKNAC